MKQRTRISPQQIRILKIAAEWPGGLDKEQVYISLLGIKPRFQRRWEKLKRVPDTVKASVHRSLVRLADAGFLVHTAPPGKYRRHHEALKWHLTIKGVQRCREHGIEPAPFPTLPPPTEKQMKRLRGIPADIVLHGEK